MNEEEILRDLTETCKQVYGLHILNAMPIKRGWLNLKWKLATDSGLFILKQYNKERFRLYDPDALEHALSQQVRLHERGIPCPKLYPKNGRFLLRSANGERFMIMSYCDGENVLPGMLNAQQMYEWGQAAGAMHQLLNDGTLGNRSATAFKAPDFENRLAYWREERQKANSMKHYDLFPKIEAQFLAMEAVQTEEWETLEAGWAHRDLWVDNSLFLEDHLAAVLDFDRLNYDYPALDVARAVISGALHNACLNKRNAAAFMQGYQENQTVPDGFLAKSLKWLWMMESKWWIHAEMNEETGPPLRFSEEMDWLAKNMKHLPNLLDNQ